MDVYWRVEDGCVLGGSAEWVCLPKMVCEPGEGMGESTAGSRRRKGRQDVHDEGHRGACEGDGVRDDLVGKVELVTEIDRLDRPASSAGSMPSDASCRGGS